uniref:Ribosomal protein L11 n=1 Tax=Lotharella vacuolata TaxID=74820 RepID=A0A0H5BK82_9EUKA|nr:ribosomal protein L11 [Lotharella vacuolata]
MKNININTKFERIILLIQVGTSGNKLQRAAKLIKKITNQKPTFAKAKKTNKSFGIRKGEFISCHCSVRGKKGILLLFKGMQLKNFSLTETNFSDNANVSKTFNFTDFGIKDHLNLGFKYDQTIGIFGFQFCTTLYRKGMRVRFRKKLQRKIKKKHRITKEQSIKWFKKFFYKCVKVYL